MFLTVFLDVLEEIFIRNDISLEPKYLLLLGRIAMHSIRCEVAALMACLCLLVICVSLANG